MASDRPPNPAFFLLPLNKTAEEVVSHSKNKRYYWPTENERPALYVTIEPGARITLGSDSAVADIFLPKKEGAEISGEHCSFTSAWDSGAVVIHDTSKRRNTEVYDDQHFYSIPIAKPSYTVVVSMGFNRKIGIGHKKYYRFELHWHADIIEEILTRTRGPVFGPMGSDSQPRYVRVAELGTGAFGSVYKAVNIANGEYFAVKRFHNLEGSAESYAKREVQNLKAIHRGTQKQHARHILNIIDFEFGSLQEDNPTTTTTTSWMEMFMPLKDGSLSKLIPTLDETDIPIVAESILRQMFSALTVTASLDIIHRDIKPENILYDHQRDKRGLPYYHFYLADFGLSQKTAWAITRAGTEPFMAPEVANRGAQTPKVDIWSLFATIVWVWMPEEFHNRSRHLSPEDIHLWLQSVAEMPRFKRIRNMTQYSPEDRPSAQDLYNAKAWLPVDTDDDDAVPGLIGAMGSMGMVREGPGSFDATVTEATGHPFGHASLGVQGGGVGLAAQAGAGGGSFAQQPGRSWTGPEDTDEAQQEVSHGRHYKVTGKGDRDQTGESSRKMPRNAKFETPYGATNSAHRTGRFYSTYAPLSNSPMAGPSTSTMARDRGDSSTQKDSKKKKKKTKEDTTETEQAEHEQGEYEPGEYEQGEYEGWGRGPDVGWSGWQGGGDDYSEAPHGNQQNHPGLWQQP